MKTLFSAAALTLMTATAAFSQITRPDEYYAQKMRADSLYRAARLDLAAPLYRELLAYSDWDGELWLAYARTLATQHNNAEAIAAYQKAIERGGGYTAEAMFAVARIEAENGNRDAVLRWLARALENHLPSRERLRTDTAFAKYRADPEFQKLALSPPASLTRDQKWQFDLDYFVTEAKRLHASFERQAYSPAFDSVAASIRKRIPQLSDDQIVGEMRKLVVLLDDGHSGVYVTNGARLPITMYWFKDGVFVIRDFSDSPEKHTRGDTTLLGSRVVAIEGVPVETAIQRLSQYITRDNEMGVRSAAPVLLGSKPNLGFAGLLKDTTALTMTVRNRNGRERNVRIPFVAAADFTKRVAVANPDSAQQPLFIRRMSAPYWLQVMRDPKAVYVQFNSVRNMPGQPISDFAKVVADSLRSANAKNLIMDIRWNGGGNSYLFPPFIKMMVAFREASPENRVFVIIGRQTFSAAQNFAVAIDQQVGAIFVGEPTGSRINFTGESAAFTLPFSGIRANVSWRWHQYGQWVDQRKWIAPQLPVEMSSEDYFSGRDVALEAIRSLE